MKVVVLYSGGLDSTVVLAKALHEGHQVLAISIDYNQANRRELACCAMLQCYWGFEHKIIQQKLPYSDPAKQIPARNTIFLAKALEQALIWEAQEVWYGAEPDSTYPDSSVAYIDAMDHVFQLHGIRLLAPIKTLPNKLAVLQQALDLGVPLDIIHSSLGKEVDGNDKTSKRFLDALNVLFPLIGPRVLLDFISDAHEVSNKQPFHIYSHHTGSFKYLPALFLLTGRDVFLTPDHDRVEMPVYTTGNWGKSLVYANQLAPRYERIVPILKTNPDVLALNKLNTNLEAAVWGTKQMLSRLPRPQFQSKPIVCRQTQGHLSKTLTDMGYVIIPVKAGQEVSYQDQEVDKLITESPIKPTPPMPNGLP